MANERPRADELAAALPGPLDDAPSQAERDRGGVSASEVRYRALVRNLPDTVVAVYDRDLRGVSIEGPLVSADARQRFRGAPLREFLPPDGYELLEPYYRAALGGEGGSVEYSPEGQAYAYHLQVVPLRDDESGEVAGVFTVARNVSERKRIEREDRQRARQQSAIATLGVAALEGRDISALMDEAVTLVASTLGLELCELLELTSDREALVLRAGTGWRPGLVRLAMIPMGSEFYAGFAWGSRGQVRVDDYAQEKRFRPTPLLVDHGARSGLCVVMGGKRRPLGVLAAHSIEPRSFRQDELDFLQAIANVLAEAINRQTTEDEVRHRALHDSLTGLPNRTLLLERLGHWLEGAARTGAAAAVLFVDLDRFKLINDALGHDAGDDLLCGVADRLRSELRASDTVARVGGDEFVILCEEATSEHEAMRMVERLRRAFDDPFDLRGRTHHVTASIGIALWEPGVDAEALMRNADVAMYRAKERGRARWELFDHAMRERSTVWLRTEAELRQALERRELRNFYQPIVSPGDGRIVGFEALVRWQHPTRGQVSPADFIPVAEQSGLIVPLGEAVLREACSEAMRWQQLRGEPVRVSVNLSPRQLSDPSLVESVAGILEATGLDPALLSLEITETALMDDAAAAIQTLEQLKDVGVRLELDDFGTGYSSLTYVRRLPIDALKIDRSFVQGLGHNPEDTAIVNAVISMARALGVHVVAEGVESEDQARHLTSLGCALAQGFLFSRPVPPDGAEDLLAAGER